jgi:zinc transport system substrate-binding protein
MVSKALRVFGVVMVVLVFLAGCAPAAVDKPVATDSTLVVTVSVLPQKYFIERIGGEHVQVNVMIPPGADPHTYEPKPEQMTSLSDSAAYFKVGITFEEVWLKKMQEINAEMKVVDTAAGITLMPEADGHADEADSQHEGEGLDTHIWTSPELVRTQVQNILDALVVLDAAHAEDYRANAEAFLADITQLQADIHAVLDSAPNRKFLVYHPAWGYFAREFGLEQMAIELGGTEPSAKELASIIQTAKTEKIKVIFVQPEFSQTAARTIASEIGGQVVAVSPLAEDWLGNMRKVADAFASALK